MSDNEINVVIAEACGYRVKTANPSGKTECWHDDRIGWRSLPNYTTDLNAMHEVEKLFEPKKVSDLNKPDLLFKYTSHLAQICIGHFGGQTRATARHRAEAFLRALGRWKEQEICSNKPKPKGN